MLLRDTYQQILVSADQVEEIQQALSRSRCQLGCIVRLILLMVKLMNTATEEDYSDLQAALTSAVYDTEEQVRELRLRYRILGHKTVKSDRYTPKFLRNMLP